MLRKGPILKNRSILGIDTTEATALLTYDEVIH